MRSVTSKDGTPVAYRKTGTGPALLILGGALTDHEFYTPLADAMATRFTVYAIDRRGRGSTPDKKPYAVEREIEDVAAVMQIAGDDPVFVYGHSAGAALAIRAAAAGLGIAKLVLADPPYTPRGSDDAAAGLEHSALAARIERLNSQGDFKGSAKAFLGGFGMTESELDDMLDSAAGAKLTVLARTLPNDFMMLGDGLVPTALAASVRCPTLILAPGSMPEAALQLASALPNARFMPTEAPIHELSPAGLSVHLTAFLDG